MKNAKENVQGKSDWVKDQCEPDNNWKKKTNIEEKMWAVQKQNLKPYSHAILFTVGVCLSVSEMSA